MAGPSERYGDSTNVHAFRIERLHWASMAAGPASLAVGRVRVTAGLTTEDQEADVAVLHGEDGMVACRVRTAAETDEPAKARSTLFREVARAAPATWLEALSRHFGGRGYGVDDVFPDERRRLLIHFAGRALATPSKAATGVDFLETLHASGGSIPSTLEGVASQGLRGAARESLDALVTGGRVTTTIAALRDLVARAGRLGVPLGLDPGEAASRLESALDRVLGALRAGPTLALVTDGLDLLSLRLALGAQPDLWAVQNAAAHLWRAGSPADRDVLALLMRALGFAPAVFAAPQERG
jgi:hypothetical protein